MERGICSAAAAASRAVKMCITPSAPPGTLYFHGPASDVSAPAVLWIVRTDYSVGVGWGEGTGSLFGVCLRHVMCASELAGARERLCKRQKKKKKRRQKKRETSCTLP